MTWREWNNHFRMTPNIKVLSIMARRPITIWRPKGLGAPLPGDVEFTRFGFKTTVWRRNDMRPTTTSWPAIGWKCAPIVYGDVVRTKRLHARKDVWNPFIAIRCTTLERVKAGSKSPLPRQTVFQAIKPVRNRTKSKSKLRRKWPLVIQSCKLTQNKSQNPKDHNWHIGTHEFLCPSKVCQYIYPYESLNLWPSHELYVCQFMDKKRVT